MDGNENSAKKLAPVDEPGKRDKCTSNSKSKAKRLPLPRPAKQRKDKTGCTNKAKRKIDESDDGDFTISKKRKKRRDQLRQKKKSADDKTTQNEFDGKDPPHFRTEDFPQTDSISDEWSFNNPTSIEKETEPSRKIYSKEEGKNLVPLSPNFEGSCDDYIPLESSGLMIEQEPGPSRKMYSNEEEKNVVLQSPIVEETRDDSIPIEDYGVIPKPRKVIRQKQRLHKRKCKYPKCEFIYTSRIDKLKHDKKVHDARFDYCHGCKMEFNAKKAKEHYRNTHLTLEKKCFFVDCDFEYYDKAALVTHIANKHRTERGFVNLVPRAAYSPVDGHFQAAPIQVVKRKLEEIGISENYHLLENSFSIHGFDQTVRMARWSLEVLVPAKDSKCIKTPHNYFKDKRVPLQLTKWGVKDFKDSVFGHLVAAANAETTTEEGRKECYRLTNMVVMNRGINSGVWLVVENHARKLAKWGWTVTVISGPIFDDDCESREVTGCYNITKAKAFFKILLLQRENCQTAYQCFIIPNQKCYESVWKHRVELDEVCARTGIQFLYKISKSITSWSKEFMSKILKCTVCGQAFFHLDDLQKHNHSHEISFVCLICKQVFQTKDDLHTHRQSHRIYKCSICERRYFSLVDMERCLDCHKNVKRHKCERCGKSYRSKMELSRHIKAAHLRLDRFCCTVCMKRFSRHSSYFRHIKSYHSSARPFVCTTCSMGFKQKQDLSRHVKAVHLNERPFICSICGRAFSFEPNLKVHIYNLHTKTKRFVCNVCAQVFQDKLDLKKHKETDHSEPNPFVCKFCSRRYTRKGDLNKHIAAVHMNKRFVCQECGKMFTQKGNLERHIDCLHLKEQKLFSCDLCNKTFKHNSLLYGHKRTVHGEKNHLCELCGKLLGSESSLRSHIKLVHLNERKFVCTLCDKKYNQKGELDKHIRTAHLKEKPFACPVCAKKFGTKGTLKGHMKTHDKSNNENQFACPICGKKICSKGNLKRHMKVHGETNKKPE